MNKDDQDYLIAAFSCELNYGANDLFNPINPLTYRTPEGDTCLHISARRGDLCAVKLLVDAGLDVNAIGDMGSTPLHKASARKHQIVIDYLISKGANPEIINEFGKRALEE